jgi:predicted transposase YbfD/YdcC
MVSILTIFRGIEDPRTGNAIRHDLLDVLVIALTASICGCENCVEFADFAQDREALFREFLRLENGPPSHDTFSRLFRLLDPDRLAATFGQFVAALGAQGPGVIAIDGKTLRRSFDRAAGSSALQVVTAFAAQAQLAIGQKAVPEGGSESLAARELLGLIDCRGALVTGDALHCTAETASLVVERGGDYLFALKGGRPRTLADVEAWFDDPENLACDSHTTVDADHGRIEEREHAVVHEVDWLFPEPHDPSHPPLPELSTIARVISHVERDGKPAATRRYYLSSAKLTAEGFAKAVRSHWAIENSLHWVLDMDFDEDRARARKDHAAENLATLRKLALNVLKTSRPTISIRRKPKRAGWSDAFARSLLGQMR